MKKKGVGVLAVSLSTVGMCVGAGFISGQELAQFFIHFERWGLLGWAFCSLIICLGAGLSLETISKLAPESFDELVGRFAGTYFARLVNLIINGYLVGGLVIMVSGAGNLIVQILDVPLMVGVTILSLAIFLTIIGHGERYLGVNKYIVPILITLTVVVALGVLFSREHAFSFDKQVSAIKSPSPILLNWWMAVILYIGYNAIGAFVGMVNIAREITPREGRIGGRLGGAIIAGLGTFLIATLWLTYPSWSMAELPIVSVLAGKYQWLYPVFAPSMLIAMFTVAASYALGMSKYVKSKTRLDFNLICAGLLIVTIPISLLGFSRLLGLIYPFFGIMATLILIVFSAKFALVRLKTLKEEQDASRITTPRWPGF